MDPTLAVVLGLAQLGTELAQQYASGQLTADQVKARLAQAGVNVDQAIAAWQAAKAAPAAQQG